MRIEIELPCTEEELAAAKESAAQGNPSLLRSLCQKERERFEGAMQQHPEYTDGLVQIERLAVEGYLYQKLRGHIDAQPSSNNLPTERKDGSP